jgi:hypothetical protein
VENGIAVRMAVLEKVLLDGAKLDGVKNEESHGRAAH